MSQAQDRQPVRPVGRSVVGGAESGADVADAAWMGRALALAAQGLGRTSPNPSVGAVLVKDGVPIGTGRTTPAGGPHAEVGALKSAGPEATGATLYVTLEPCCHTGRTAPCTDAILAAGIVRVVFAVRDPNPRVDGGGEARLRAAGIQVTAGVGAAEARSLYAPFARWITTGRPFVTAKWAMTLDGRIATRTGDSRWISGPAARAAAHRLRDTVDAVVVGAETVIQDDPRLTVRLGDDPVSANAPLDGPFDGPDDGRQPLRVVLDSRGRVPHAARVLDVSAAPTLVATVAMPARRAAALRARGVEVIAVPADADGRVDVSALLDVLGRRGLLHVLVEGGAEVHGSFVAARAVDAVWAVVAPVIVGGATAPGPVGGRGAARMAEAVRLTETEVRVEGDDVVVHARPMWPVKRPDSQDAPLRSSTRRAAAKA